MLCASPVTCPPILGTAGGLWAAGTGHAMGSLVTHQNPSLQAAPMKGRGWGKTIGHKGHIHVYI